MSKFLLVLVLTSVIICKARVISDPGNQHPDGEPLEEKHPGVGSAEDFVDNIRNLRPVWFGINRGVFRVNKPCPQEGFKRDLAGRCREVWD